MMKRKFLAVILPIIGCATLVGSGFSAWYFGVTTGVSGQWVAAVDVTPDISGKDVISLATKTGNDYLQDNEYLILDQGTVDTSSETYGKVGIAFVDGVTSETVPTVIPKESTTKRAVDAEYNNQNQNLKTLYNNGMEVVITMKIKVHNTLEKYIVLDTTQKFKLSSNQSTVYANADLSFDGSTSTDGNYTVYTLTYKPTIRNVGLTNVTWTIELDMSTENKANKLLSYETETVEDSKVAKPKSSKDLEKMSRDLTTNIGEGSAILFDAKIAIVDRKL